MGGEGLERLVKTSHKSHVATRGGTESGTVRPDRVSGQPTDLLEVVKAWSTLPAALRAGILAMIHAMELHESSAFIDSES